MEKCPKCNKNLITKAGLVQNKQRYKCKSCSYHFTGNKLTKAIDNEKVITCLELYLCGLSYRDRSCYIGFTCKCYELGEEV